MGDWDFQIFGIKIDYLRGLNGPLEGQGGARESKIMPKTGPKTALFGLFWVLYVKNRFLIFIQTP